MKRGTIRSDLVQDLVLGLGAVPMEIFLNVEDVLFELSTPVSWARQVLFSHEPCGPCKLGENNGKKWRGLVVPCLQCGSTRVENK